MKVVEYKHMLMIDSAYHVVFNFEGKLGHVRIPMGGVFAKAVADGPDKLQEEIEKLVGEKVILKQNERDWANIRGTDGLVDHPFDGTRGKIHDMHLSYSNFLDENWARWFPEDLKPLIIKLAHDIGDRERALEEVRSQLNAITSIDYSNEKARYEQSRRS